MKGHPLGCRCDACQATGQVSLFGPPPARVLPHFDGETYEPAKDHSRLGVQFLAVRGLMSDGAWRTLSEMASSTGFPEASISARLRDLRKAKFGAHKVERRRSGEGRAGLHEYRLVK